MNSIFESFLEGGYSYNYANGPDIVRSEEDAKRKGLNCIALMHLLSHELFGIDLPDFLKGWEMYCDNPFLTVVPSSSESEFGDIFFFGRRQLPDYALHYEPVYDENGALLNKETGDQLIGQQYAGVHTAMHTGDFLAQDDPLLIHANKLEGTIVVWPLSKFVDLEQYSTNHAIKRVNR